MNDAPQKSRDFQNISRPRLRFKRKKAMIVVLALTTFPISLPFFAIKTVRRKMLKSQAAKKIEQMNQVPVAKANAAAPESPLLSIVMPVYNIEAYLEASILSVLNQSYTNFELIIVNDGSTDGSLSVARMFEEIDNRVQVIDLPYNTVGGAGIPSNFGMEHAKGEYLTFVDGDDFLSPFSFEKVMAQILSAQSEVAVGSFKTFDDESKKIAAPYDATMFSQVPVGAPLHPKENPKALMISAVPWRKVYKSSFLAQHNIRFPEGDLFYEDNTLHWDVMTAAGSVVFAPVTVSFHRMNREGQTIAAAAPKLAAFFQHLTAISKRIQKNKANFAWEPFATFVKRANWITERQTDPALAEQFRVRFNQVIDEHVEPYLPAKSSRSLARARAEFDTPMKPAEFSFILFHDEERAGIEDLTVSINSIEALQNATAEVFVLYRNDAPPVGERQSRVFCIQSNAPIYRAYNQTLQLCSGKYIAFLRSGDQVDASVVADASRKTWQDVDLFEGADQKQSGQASFVSGLYGRRLIQDNAVFFGPSALGFYSFDQLCRVFASETKELSSPVVLPAYLEQAAFGMADTANEAGYLARKAFGSDAGEDRLHVVLDLISGLFDHVEKDLQVGAMPELERARSYVSDQISAVRRSAQ